MISAKQDKAAIQRCLARLDELKRAWIDIADRQTQNGDFAYANEEPSAACSRSPLDSSPTWIQNAVVPRSPFDA